MTITIPPETYQCLKLNLDVDHSDKSIRKVIQAGTEMTDEEAEKILNKLERQDLIITGHRWIKTDYNKFTSNKYYRIRARVLTLELEESQ